METSEAAALRATLDWAEGWSEWSVIAVFLGLVVEYTILLWLKRKEFTWLEISLTILAGIAIAGGVGGEYVFGSKVADAARKLQNISDRELARANIAAEEARKQTNLLRK